MRKLFVLITAVTILSFSAAAQNTPPSASLGDVARQSREANKPRAKRVYTNEDVAKIQAPLNQPTITPPPGKSDTAKPDAGAKDSSANTSSTAKNADTDPEEESPENHYRKEFETERAAVQKLEKEIDELKRQLQVQSTNYYMDAGNRLRDPKAWTEQRAKLDEQITAKEKALEEARNKVESLSEQMRKLGVAANQQ